LEDNFQTWNAPENLHILAALIPRAFIQSAEVDVPCKNVKKQNFKVRKSEEWIKAEFQAKKASKRWAMSGKPSDLDNTFFIQKKQARGELRSTIKNHFAKEAVKDNNTMMNANFKDPKLFSKMVNKKRKNSQGYTAKITFDNQVYKGDAQVLSGFFEYHDNMEYL
jgi:hypothetical protein